MTLFGIAGLYEELLLQGSFRGVGFAHVAGDDEPGRRIQAFLFPGQDVVSYQDLGLLDNDIIVKGILAGDDFVAQADALRAAFWTPGPGTLVSPWLGTLQVVQAPGKLPRFSFEHDRLRICTFAATFRRYVPPVIPGPDTLQGLLNSLRALRTAVYQMLATVLAPVALVLSAVSQVESLAGEVAGVLGGLIAPCGNPLVGIAGALPIALLADIAGSPLDATFATSVGDRLSGPSAAIAGTSTPAIPAAVASGGSITTPDPVDGRITATLLLSAVSQLGAVTLSGAPIQIPPGPALILCAQTFMLADATSAASAIDFDSQQEAIVWRDKVSAAIDAATLAAQKLVPASATAASALWRSLIAARAAWIANMNSTIGSLPPVVTFTPPARLPVWVLAQFLAGDDPSAIVATYRDLIKRNGIVHPAEPPSGPLEVLA